MKMFSILPDLPELQGLDTAQRSKTIKEWEREIDRSWSGYLQHVGVVLVLFVIFQFGKVVLFSRYTSSWFDALPFVFAWLLGEYLYKRFVMLKRRDLLQRILEQRRRTPVCAIGSSIFSIHLMRAWLAVISYCLLFLVAPVVVLVCFSWRYRHSGAFAASLVLMFVFLAVGESGFRIWKRMWRIP